MTEEEFYKESLKKPCVLLAEEDLEDLAKEVLYEGVAMFKEELEKVSKEEPIVI